ncbi:lipopolysaccharide biosynthesis protein [Porphyromonas pogonae]|uniref:lipopolysaccharide biosynthesis protein n=1 Tax=Porphyromonas pogonae TaxID=867595 RepID=UPI002E777D91|nr:oligosaccharide flippase family protein [Porphyromonas pogonae]
MNIHIALKRFYISQLGKDILYSLFAQIVIFITAFIVNKIISNHLGIGGFGAYNIIKRSANLLAVFIVGGMNIALPRFFAMYKAHLKYHKLCVLQTSSYIVVCINILVLIIFMLLYPSLSVDLFLGKNFGHEWLYTLFFYSLSLALNSMVLAYCNGNGKYKEFNVIQIITQLFYVFGAVFFSFDCKWLFFVWSMLIFIYSLFKLIFYTRQNHLLILRSFKYRILMIKKIVLYGFPRMISDMLMNLGDFIPLLIIQVKYGNISLGLFSAAISIQLLIAPLFAFTGNVILQRVSLWNAKKEFKKISNMIFIMGGIFVIIALFGAFIISLFSDILLRLFFNDEFLLAKNMASILAFSLIPRSLYLLLRNPLDAISSFPYNLLTMLLRIALYISLLYSSSNVEECAWAYLWSYTLAGVLSIFFWLFAFKKIRKKIIIHK